jgi:hypothetical protein
MHQHIALFWLKEQLSDAEILEFEQGLNNLTKISLVLSGSYGKPADTHRSVVENTYSYGLILLFKDISDHNLYQADPFHQSFVNHNSQKWIKVQVLDIETT